MNPTPEGSGDDLGAVTQIRHPSPWPMRLAIVVAVVAAVCVSGLAVGYHYYDSATKPNRGAPDVVVDNYLRAFLVHRNDEEAAQYACSDQSGLAALIALRDDLDRRSKQLGGSISVEWQVGDVTQTSDSSASVATRLVIIAASTSTLRESQPWVFGVRGGSGWHVCSATRAQAPASPAPSLSP